MKSVLGASMIAALATGLASTAHGASALDNAGARSEVWDEPW
jgi:hypothetical protein